MPDVINLANNDAAELLHFAPEPLPRSTKSKEVKEGLL